LRTEWATPAEKLVRHKFTRPKFIREITVLI